GRLPRAFWRGGAAPPACTRCPACVCTTAAPTPVIAEPARNAAPPTPEAAPEIEAVRYPVCEREESAPALSRLRLGGKGPELWALPCGPSMHLFSIERDGERLRPLRVARLEAPSYNPAQAPRALPLAAADVDGDGRADLLAPVLLLDRAGAPSGGALYWLRQR